jgi:hydroxyethylthiazole kinase
MANPTNLIRVMPAEGEEMRNSDPSMHASVPQTAAALVARLRARAPRVHCITNTVAQNFTANALLAAGAVPSMTLAADEIGGFVAGAQALLVNLGTFDAERREATRIAVATARERRIPWVLDPVFVDRSPQRAAFARELIALHPAVVRLNRAEFEALAGAEATREAVGLFARGEDTVIALSGATDLVTDGARFAAIGNGDPLMAKVTAMGCAGSSLVAACLAVMETQDAFAAAASALLMFGVAGERAAASAQGPGSFAVAFLDALHAAEPAALLDQAKVVP